MEYSRIIDNIARIREQIPDGVKIEAAAKTRSAEECKAAIEGGIDFLGYNYVQEGLAVAAEMTEAYGPETTDSVQFSLIGHLQKNKINKAVSLFSMIETVDSLKKASQINSRVPSGKPVDVLIQVNIGSEESKSGASFGKIREIAEGIEALEHVALRGLMTIEPYEEDPEESRKYFSAMKKLYDQLRDSFGEGICYLSMGMSHSWPVAVEEGASIIRVGTGIFGPRV